MIVVVDFRELPRVNNGMGPASEAIDAGVLFETYHERIYRYVLHLVKNPAEAEDLTQDTFLRAYRHGNSLRDPQAVRGTSPASACRRLNLARAAMRARVIVPWTHCSRASANERNSSKRSIHVD